ncbi:MAG: HNH endonuclease [Desulfovibrio sp.]|nr:HNH endonuclease [Desulfovibrio sp.]
MKFSPVQQKVFKALKGSYSPVTEREVYDGQITATDAERDLLEAYFAARGESIYKGNVKSGQERAVKIFRKWPNGEEVRLHLVYPKPSKTELRLYIAKKRGFLPDSGNIWFLFVDDTDKNLWIGSLPEKEFRALSASWRENEEDVPDEKATTQVESADEEDVLQEEGAESGNATDGEERPQKEKQAVGDTAGGEKTPKPVSKNGKSGSLPSNLAVSCMQRQKYKCGFDRLHPLFLARATGCPYLEVHHIVPREFADSFRSKNLNDRRNLVALCPNCHRAIHHAEIPLVKEILQRIVADHETDQYFGLTMEELFQLYGVEEIIK